MDPLSSPATAAITTPDLSYLPLSADNIASSIDEPETSIFGDIFYGFAGILFGGNFCDNEKYMNI